MDKNFYDKFQKIFAEYNLFDVEALSNELINLAKDFIVTELSLKSNSIELDANTLKKFESITNKLTERFKTSDIFSKGLVTILGEIKGLNDSGLQYYSKKGFTPSANKLNATQKLIFNNFVDDLVENGLKKEFAVPIKKEIYKYATTGKKIKDIEKDLNKNVNVKGIKNYSRSISYQVANSYTGAINENIFENYGNDFTHIGVVGTVIESSAPQCKLCIEKYKREVPIEDFKKIVLPLAEDNGLIPGTDMKNVFTNLLHWGCRHQFYPLIN
jgi:hypothetical protein